MLNGHGLINDMDSFDLIDRRDTQWGPMELRSCLMPSVNGAVIFYNLIYSITAMNVPILLINGSNAMQGLTFKLFFSFSIPDKYV